MRIAIQGEKGSNSHMAAVQMFANATVSVDVVTCAFSAEVIGRVVGGEVEGAVLPIENSLHGSVAEHYDLLLKEPVRVVRESSMRIRHNVMALPGVRLEEVRRVLSHPVALSQCRRWLLDHREIESTAFYDTAGSVKHVIEAGLRDAAGVAPAMAAEVYGAEVLVEGIEDHAENFTRFYLIAGEEAAKTFEDPGANKMSIAFAVEHRPGTLVGALEGMARAGADLTKIESRPVPGRPWEYVFYVDLQFREVGIAERAMEALRERCGFVRELGRYAAAVNR